MSNRQPAKRGRVLTHWPLIIALLTDVAITLVFYSVVRDREESLLKAELERRGRMGARALQQGIDRNVAVLKAIAGLYASEGEVDRKSFRAFVDAGGLVGDDVQALEWIPRVPDAERARYESHARKTWRPDFRFTERRPDGQMVTAARRDEYFPVYFVEPIEGNDVAIGFDLASERVRRAALHRARDTGQLTTTGRIRLVQEIGSQARYLIFAPVYSVRDADTESRRRSTLIGYVLGIFRVGVMARGNLDEAPLSGLEMLLYDDRGGGKESLLYMSRPELDAQSSTGLSTRLPLSVPDREWSAVFSPTQELVLAYGPRRADEILAAGLLYTLILAIFLGIYFFRLNKRTAELWEAHDTLEERVQQRTREQREARELLDAVVENMGTGLTVVDTNANFVLFNQPAEAIMGVGATDGAPEEWADTYGMFQSDHVTPVATKDFPILRALNGETVRDFEAFVRNQMKPEGVSISITGTPLRDEAGDVTGGIALFQDVTERKKVEETVRKLNAELLRSNTELEQFAYAASHDLQEPLRVISNYTELVASEFKGQLSEDADQYLGFAADGARRMQALLVDLLEYSRLGRSDEESAEVEMNLVLEDTLKNLEVAISESGAKVTFDSLPRLWARRTQMLRLLQNLIENGIKFRGSEPPRIHVSAERKGSLWEFCVRDNGIGISAQHFDQILVPFRRLHTREEYQGTGIGLAMCKKIVEQRGGQLWVESQEDEGSTFCFTIPAEQT